MPEGSGEFEIVIERTKTIDSSGHVKKLAIENNLDSDVKVKATYTKTLDSDDYVKQGYRVVRTDTTESSSISLTSIEFSATKSVSLYYVHLKCRGLTGAAAQIKLTLTPYGGGASVDSDTVNIGSNASEYILHKFTFSSPVYLPSGGLNVITITEVVGQVDVKCGIDDNSSWSVVGKAED